MARLSAGVHCTKYSITPKDYIVETTRQLYGSCIAAANSTAQAPDFCTEYGRPFGYIAGGL